MSLKRSIAIQSEPTGTLFREVLFLRVTRKLILKSRQASSSQQGAYCQWLKLSSLAEKSPSSFCWTMIQSLKDSTTRSLIISHQPKIQKKDNSLLCIRLVWIKMDWLVYKSVSYQRTQLRKLKLLSQRHKENQLTNNQNMISKQQRKLNRSLSTSKLDSNSSWQPKK